MDPKTAVELEIAYWEGYLQGLKEGALLVTPQDQSKYIDRMLFILQKIAGMKSLSKFGKDFNKLVSDEEE